MSVSQNSNDELPQHVHDVLKEAFSQEDKAVFVTRWVLSIETFDDSGTKSCIHLTAPDMLPWEVIGMSEAMSEIARMQFQNNIMNDMYAEDDEYEDDSGN